MTVFLHKVYMHNYATTCTHSMYMRIDPYLRMQLYLSTYLPTNVSVCLRISGGCHSVSNPQPVHQLTHTWLLLLWQRAANSRRHMLQLGTSAVYSIYGVQMYSLLGSRLQSQIWSFSGHMRCTRGPNCHGKVLIGRVRVPSFCD